MSAELLRKAAALMRSRAGVATVEARNAAALALHVIEDSTYPDGDSSACMGCGYISDDMDANPCPTRRVLLGIEPW